jgi:hypothetical protein
MGQGRELSASLPHAQPELADFYDPMRLRDGTHCVIALVKRARDQVLASVEGELAVASQ